MNYFRRNFDMHWTDGYSADELSERDRRITIAARRQATLNNIVLILDDLRSRIEALERQGKA